MIRIKAQSAPWYDGIEILVGYQRGEKILLGVFDAPNEMGQEGTPNVEFAETPLGARQDATFILRHNIAQELMNDLWHCGLRPSNEVGNVGELRATQTHLEDMRKQNTKLLDKVLEDNNEQR